LFPLGEVGIEKIMDIKEDNNIEVLILSLNHLGEKGGMILFQNLIKLENLELLRVDGCSLGPKTAAKIREYLETDFNIEKMVLSVNNFGTVSKDYNI
jgi:hypothetical protein